jgi:putative N6-adenine-specific DNA methylase
LEAAATNITAALLDDEIRLRRADFVGSSSDNPMFIVMNPPYNERLTVSEKQLYRSIGDTLKQGYAGSVAAVFSASVEGLKSLGLRPSKKFALYNGALPASLWLLEMYDGSRRQTGVQNKENNEG